MNERTRELAEQAGWMMGDEVEGFNTRLEKFAELLVRECADIATKHQEQGVSEVSIGESIKEHFGVEP